MCDASVERLDRSVGAGLHHSAFHYREDELRKAGQVGRGGKLLRSASKTIGDSGGPAVEIVREALVNPELFFRNLKSETADGAAIGASSGEQVAAVEIEDAEDAIDGVGNGRKNRFDDNGEERLNVVLKDRKEQFFLGLEKEVKAAGIGLCAGTDFCNACGSVSAEPKQIESGVNEALTRGRAFAAGCHTYMNAQLIPYAGQVLCACR